MLKNKAFKAFYVTDDKHDHYIYVKGFNNLTCNMQLKIEKVHL